VERAVNKTIRELTAAGAVGGARAAHVELAKLTARRLDAAQEADHGAEVVKLTTQLRGLLAELEPRGSRVDRSTISEPSGQIAGGAPADLDALLRAGPTMGHTT
jgi:hypothetical protein